MSRFSHVLGAASVLALSLFSSVALADVAYVPNEAPHFAKAPSEAVDMPPPGVVAPARTLDRDSVRAALVVQRAKNLAAFRAYQKAGVFPNNVVADRKLNVWRDERNHLCAAATIINMSGQTELVNRVAEQNNYIKLGDVTTGPLMDWILTSGFTQDEIAAIQEPYMPIAQKLPRPRREDPRVVDARLRAAETARLAKRYTEVDAMVVKNQKASIEAAVTRLMKHQQLAWTLIDRA